ncbi:hypothetical protein GGTG_01905 [Gaeumannomyces tritici R3-111a-1]|uniref:Uncharacterized protein n=1 Tax=Gaeumannomyces tritici (strain R3-111a-1) TaxID=644352 RepID=J3NKW4_GAET3|nr:hypothetical protein GGTG_01905 [Gaeumannomyces tritici R3-111a-1]EJT81931.1 hypothetical protein GGTG_01905 [Gaeumannomyces tritici R3-111a-1]
MVCELDGGRHFVAALERRSPTRTDCPSPNHGEPSRSPEPRNDESPRPQTKRKRRDAALRPRDPVVRVDQALPVLCDGGDLVLGASLASRSASAPEWQLNRRSRRRACCDSIGRPPCCTAKGDGLEAFLERIDTSPALDDRDLSPCEGWQSWFPGWQASRDLRDQRLDAIRTGPATFASHGRLQPCLGTHLSLLPLESQGPAAASQRAGEGAHCEVSGVTRPKLGGMQHPKSTSKEPVLQLTPVNGPTSLAPMNERASNIKSTSTTIDHRRQFCRHEPHNNTNNNHLRRPPARHSPSDAIPDAWTRM